jgi:hemolysin activation/secretion protein
VPENAESLFVRVGDFFVQDGYPEFSVETEALLSPIRNERVSVARLYGLAESVERIYRAAGYALVRVVIPPQKLTDGDTLRLIVLDGFIERIDVDAVDTRSRDHVAKTMQGLVGQRQIRGEDLERALTLAGRLPGLELRSAMGAGVAPGAVVLVLEGRTTLASGAISADNQLSDALGPWQTTMQATLNQPAGLNMQLYVNASGGKQWDAAFRSDSARRVVGGGAIVAIGNNGLSINPEFTSSTSRPQKQPNVPQSLSKFERFTVRLVYPITLNREEELTVTGSMDATRQIDSLPGFDLVAIDGSPMGNFVLNEDRLRIARLALLWNKTLGSTKRFGAGVTLSKGLSGLGARTQKEVEETGVQMSRPGADPSFLKIEGNVVYQQPIFLDLQSKTALRVQKSLKGVLPGSELFSLDGEDALSTLTSGAVSDDSGWMLRQEFSRPWRAANISLVSYAFAAAGKTTSQIENRSAQRPSKAFGIGLRSQWQNVSFSMEYGRASAVKAVSSDKQFFVKGQVQF